LTFKHRKKHVLAVASCPIAVHVVQSPSLKTKMSLFHERPCPASEIAPIRERVIDGRCSVMGIRPAGRERKWSRLAKWGSCISDVNWVQGRGRSARAHAWAFSSFTWFPTYGHFQYKHLVLRHYILTDEFSSVRRARSILTIPEA